ncbi:F-box protein At5g52880-like [Selaginella moellendorffii]|uniref:F-box protein At5g52880-like n=1 Tax=Selaginella moellendorffii TaxID=88036 RepID=UPI000D1C2D27|nr:F-box protein At5g52880-like [Selaginella moellendorffii]|eukprot:XP_024518644.1 F-box protein At5g52880-like [Selaginella moellendorffii]
MEARYSSLRLGEALNRRCDYARACKELAVLLKQAYGIAPKSLQAALFQDLLAAFRILQDHPWCSAGDFSAASALLQASDSVLPKHKKGLAAGEFRKAAISLQRSSKNQSELDESCQLPVDVLVHVFSFLDPISLATAGCVCRSWNSEYKDANLWQKLFTVVLENTSFDPTRVLQLAGFELGDDDSSTPLRVKDVSIQKIGCWKKAFEIAVLRSPKLLYLFTRAQCLTCKATFWSSELCLQTFANQCSKKNFQEHKLRPLLLEQVVSFVLMGSRQAYNTKKDSDSDEDQYLPYAKLWEYAKWLR